MSNVKLDLDYSVQFWGMQHKKDLDVLEQVQRVMRMLRELEYLSYGERLREFGQLSLEKPRLLGNLRAASQYPKGAARELERDF